jgi:hypothetical protein
MLARPSSRISSFLQSHDTDRGGEGGVLWKLVPHERHKASQTISATLPMSLKGSPPTSFGRRRPNNSRGKSCALSVLLRRSPIESQVFQVSKKAGPDTLVVRWYELEILTTLVMTNTCSETIILGPARPLGVAYCWNLWKPCCWDLYVLSAGNLRSGSMDSSRPMDIMAITLTHSWRGRREGFMKGS